MRESSKVLASTSRIQALVPKHPGSASFVKAREPARENFVSSLRAVSPFLPSPISTAPRLRSTLPRTTRALPLLTTFGNLGEQTSSPSTSPLKFCFCFFKLLNFPLSVSQTSHRVGRSVRSPRGENSGDARTGQKGPLGRPAPGRFCESAEAGGGGEPSRGEEPFRPRSIGPPDAPARPDNGPPAPASRAGERPRASAPRGASKGRRGGTPSRRAHLRPKRGLRARASAGAITGSGV